MFTFVSKILFSLCIVITIYYFCLIWYDEYDSMMTYPDGETRDDSKKNDYSDETNDAKMKYAWLLIGKLQLCFHYLDKFSLKY